MLLNFLLVSVDDAFDSRIAVDFFLRKDLILLDLFVVGVQNIAELVFELELPVFVLDELLIFVSRYFLDPGVLEDLIDGDAVLRLEDEDF